MDGRNLTRIQKHFAFDDFVAEQCRGETHGVFIDDTGSPGLPDTPVGLHPERKSWAAVIIPKHQIAQVWEELPPALGELRKQTEGQEFHFTDIYMGRRQFKSVEWEKRQAIIEFMAYIFSRNGFPIYVQTLDPESIRDWRAVLKVPEKLPPFNFKKPYDLALFMLLVHVRMHLRASYPESQRRARVFVDEGFQKNGSAVVIEPFAPDFVDSAIFFARSDLVLPLQLADFAAFCLNRSQLIIGKSERTERDLWFLRVVSQFAHNYKNVKFFKYDEWFGSSGTSH